MTDDIQKETERIHQGIVESLSFLDALAKRDEEIERLRHALGMLTTLHPTMTIDVNNPEQMAQEIVSYVTESRNAEIERLRSLLTAILEANATFQGGAVLGARLEALAREALGE